MCMCVARLCGGGGTGWIFTLFWCLSVVADFKKKQRLNIFIIRNKAALFGDTMCMSDEEMDSV